MSGIVTLGPSHTITQPTGRVTALLGPTNTGKTWFALERMKTYGTGVMGFPLRLLARENYDRLCAALGPQHVALVTGEEKIIPLHARYFMCTVESMPLDRLFDFVGIDEIQLCADPDRGHVFTDRLMRMRGVHETMVMGAETMRGVLERLLPDTHFDTRPRLSALTYTGFKKMTRLPRRTAIVAFSMEDVYRIADMVRAKRGGTAIVLGALSPRTRNAQVGMYQAGEVDYLVATDAIGMGLNMDIHHVALAATRKFDGQRLRTLTAAELAQIAGRAGRHLRDGTFGVTDNVPYLDDEVADAIEQHQFEPITALSWRAPDLDFSTPRHLLRTLERAAPSPILQRGYLPDDQRALEALIHDDAVMARAVGHQNVQLLWDVCQIPDFRKTMVDAHHALLAHIFELLCDHGCLTEAWVAAQIESLASTDGDVDGLMSRIAHIRTWTYIAHRPNWLQDAAGWQGRTRALEDKLSDALHTVLLQRFVDRRAAALGVALEGGATLHAAIQADGQVVVEGHPVGRLKGLRFEADESLKHKGRDALRVLTAARRALAPEIQRRVSQMTDTHTDGRFSLADDGQIFWQAQASNPLPGDPIGHVRKGKNILSPDVSVLESDQLEASQRDALRVRVQEWCAIHVRTVLEPLFMLQQEEGAGALQGTARGIGFQLAEHLGVMHRADLETLITGLDPEQRRALRSKGVRLGPILVFMPALVKPAAIRMRALLWALWHDRALPMARPADGRVSEVVDAASADRGFYRAIGYPVFGPRAIRIDMLDRVITDIYDSAKDGIFEVRHKYAEWLGSNLDDLYAIVEAMGHRRLQEKAPEVEAAPVAEVVVAEVAAEAAPADTTEQVDAVAADVAVPAKPAPVLVKFMLKRGKMSDRPQPAHKKPQHTPRTFTKPDAQAGAAIPEKQERGARPEQRKDNRNKQPYDPNKPKRADYSKPEASDRPVRDKRAPRDDNRKSQIMTFGPAKTDGDDDGNPFAILKNLKK